MRTIHVVIPALLRGALLPRIVGVILSFGALSGCQNDDTGRCCKVLSPSDAPLIPQPEQGPGGEPRDVIASHPAFDCDTLTCVSYQGSKAYCTRRCESAKSCPEGFACEAVLQSSAGPDAGIGPDDKFCVRLSHACPE